VLRPGETHGFFELASAAKSIRFTKLRGDSIGFMVKIGDLWAEA